MRDPNRIDRILEAIREAWAKDPDSRLGQLLCNVVRFQSPTLDIFSIEDSELEKFIVRWSEGQVMTRHVFNVADTLAIIERGLLVIADKQYGELPSWLLLKVGDEIEFRSKGDILLRCKAAGIEMMSGSMSLSIMLPSNVTKKQVPQGCEVWITESSVLSTVD